MDSTLNREIEFHDSTVAVIFPFSGSMVVIFSHAYIHASKGNPGVDAGSGWYQRAELEIAEAEDIDLNILWPLEIADGALTLDGEELRNMIPTVLNHNGKTKLHLEGVQSDGDYRAVEITGGKAVLTLLGAPYYVEEFPGAG